MPVNPNHLSLRKHDKKRLIVWLSIGFFFHLIDNGYNGIGFIIDGAFIGIEWKDLMLPGR